MDPYFVLTRLAKPNPPFCFSTIEKSIWKFPNQNYKHFQSLENYKELYCCVDIYGMNNSHQRALNVNLSLMVINL